jgi:NAD(P)-dependent dehydrogenase (short-subunit alcohol dehydrogenase family)
MTSVAIVTGAAGAMGAACALAVGAAVDVLLVTDIDESRLAATHEALARQLHADVCMLAADLGDPAGVDGVAARAGELGSLYALVHTAGLSPSMAGWREILNVDLIATARLLDQLAPQVVRGSAAVCLASVSGHMGEFDPAMDALLDDALADDFEARFRALAGDAPDPGATYRLAKRGVIRICERAAVAWGERGGRVLSLSPGLIDTAMGRLELVHNPIKEWLASITPVGHDRGGESILPGRIDDIARTVAFLCSGAASFISGCDILVDGGLMAAMHHQHHQPAPES